MMADMTFERTLRQEIAELRAAVERLETAAAPRLHLRMAAAGPRAFLGQPLALSAAAHWVSQGPARGEEPARDLPLTFVTSWGTLRATDIYADASGAQVGSSVTVHTGLDGVARITLLPPGMGQLDAAQQSALWTALDRLDANAAAPADLQPQLAELVDAYRWEANLLLRQAVDILYSANGAPIDVIEDAPAAWRQVNATVVAIAAEGAQVSAAALHTVRFLDWLRPWLQVYRQQTQRDESLARDLARTRQRRTDPRGLLDGVYRDINQYVSRQLGRIGQMMGQRAAENALRTFVQEGLAELPAATRATLFPALHVASETVTGAGVHVLSALTQARVDLRQEIGAQAAVTGSLEQAITGKLDANAFEGFRDEFKSFQESNTAALNRKANTASLTGLRNELSGLIAGKADVVALEAIKLENEGRFAALATSAGKISAQMEEVNRSLADINDRFGGLRGDLTAQLEQNQLALTQALTAVEKLQGTVGTLPTDLGTRLAHLEEQTQGVTTSLTDFERTVTTLNRNFTSLNKRIVDSGLLRPPP